MTSKDYQLVVAALSALSDYPTREQVAQKLSEAFARQNPRFDEGRFRQACGL